MLIILIFNPLLSPFFFSVINSQNISCSHFQHIPHPLCSYFFSILFFFKKKLAWIFIYSYTPFLMVDDDITNQDLRDIFYAYGEIVAIKMVGRQKCAFVEYTTREGAEKAATTLHANLVIKGRSYIHTYVFTYIHTYVHTFICTYVHT